MDDAQSFPTTLWTVVLNAGRDVTGQGHKALAQLCERLGIRPDDFEDARFSPPGLPTIDVRIALVEDLGPEALAFFALDAERVESETFGVASDGSDQEALMADDRRALFSATLDAATDARPGEMCRLTVNPARFHFFSPYNGESLLAAASQVPDRLEAAV